MCLLCTCHALLSEGSISELYSEPYTAVIVLYVLVALCCDSSIDHGSKVNKLLLLSLTIIPVIQITYFKVMSAKFIERINYLV